MVFYLELLSIFCSIKIFDFNVFVFSFIRVSKFWTMLLLLSWNYFLICFVTTFLIGITISINFLWVIIISVVLIYVFVMASRKLELVVSSFFGIKILSMLCWIGVWICFMLLQVTKLLNRYLVLRTLCLGHLMFMF